MWETISGGALEGESSLDGIIRELDEELGIKANIEDLTFIGLYIRYNDFVEIWVLKSNIDINNLKLQDSEVQAVKWVTISEYEEMVNNNTAIPTSFNIFKTYYEEYYGKKVSVVDGKL